MENNAAITAFIKEASHQSYKEGYDQAIKDALKTITNLLQHNDIRMKPKEFWNEYNNLRAEGVIVDRVVASVGIL